MFDVSDQNSPFESPWNVWENDHLIYTVNTRNRFFYWLTFQILTAVQLSSYEVMRHRLLLSCRDSEVFVVIRYKLLFNDIKLVCYQVIRHRLLFACIKLVYYGVIRHCRSPLRQNVLWGHKTQAVFRLHQTSLLWGHKTETAIDLS